MKKWILAAALLGTAVGAQAAPLKNSADIKDHTAMGAQVRFAGDIDQNLDAHHFILRDKEGKMELVIGDRVQGRKLLRPGNAAMVVGKVMHTKSGVALNVSRILDIDGARPEMMNIHEDKQ